MCQQGRAEVGQRFADQDDDVVAIGKLLVKRPAMQRREGTAFLQREEVQLRRRENSAGIGNQQRAGTLLAHLPFQ
jgi:hypothetical protein